GAWTRRHCRPSECGFGDSSLTVRGVRPVLPAPVQAALPGSHFRGMIAPNNSFKPNALRYINNMAGKACHVVASATHVGLTQALGASNLELERFMASVASHGHSTPVVAGFG